MLHILCKLFNIEKENSFPGAGTDSSRVPASWEDLNLLEKISICIKLSLINQLSD